MSSVENLKPWVYLSVANCNAKTILWTVNPASAPSKTFSKVLILEGKLDTIAHATKAPANPPNNRIAYTKNRQ